MIWFDEMVNRVAYALTREPWLIVLIPVALVAVALLSREILRLRRRAPPGSTVTSLAPDPNLCQIIEPESSPAPVSPKTEGRGLHLIEIVVISDGLHKHHKIRSDNLNFTWEGYKIEEARLYEGRLGPIEKLLLQFRGVQHKWIIPFWEGETEAVTLPIARVDPTVLARVRTARILSRAMKEIFSSALLDNKAFIFLLIIFGVIAVIVLKVQGYL